MCQTLFYIKKSRYVSKNSDRFGWLSDRNDRGRGRRCRARDMTQGGQAEVIQGSGQARIRVGWTTASERGRGRRDDPRRGRRRSEVIE